MVATSRLSALRPALSHHRQEVLICPSIWISTQVTRCRRMVIQKLTDETKKGVYDEYGVRQLELYYGDDGVYCLLEAPDKEAVRKHHQGNCGEIHEVESLI